MSELPTEQIFNIYILQTHSVNKNHRLFLTKYNYRFYYKVSEIRRLNNRYKIQQYFDSC